MVDNYFAEDFENEDLEYSLNFYASFYTVAKVSGVKSLLSVASRNWQK